MGDEIVIFKCMLFKINSPTGYLKLILLNELNMDSTYKCSKPKLGAYAKNFRNKYR